jgi:tetratricopeptide (TPR) repeat protein
MMAGAALKTRLFARGGATGAIVLASSIGSVCAISTVAPSAAAQSAAELGKARTLFKEGVSLEAAGDWAGALAKFEEVAKVKTTPQVRFHIGRCKEHLGRLNEALGEYRMAEYEAQQSKAKEAAEISQARQSLEARVPKLVITRGAGAESAKIELDGVAIGEAQVGKEVSTDPGPHKIVAKIGGGQFDVDVSVAEGETKNVELTPPEGFAAKPAPKAEEPEVKPIEDKPPPKVERKGPGALPWIIGGVGVVSLGASGYFLLQRNKAEDDLNSSCHGDVCPSNKKSVGDDGKRYATYTNVALGIGVVGIGVATVMLLSSGGEEKPEKSALRVDVVSTPRLTGVNLFGKF